MAKRITLLLAAVAVAAGGFGIAAAQDTAPAAFNHVAISVADQQKSVDFYQGLFHLREIPSPFPPGGPRWLVLANGVELHIQAGRTAPLVMPRAVHFAIGVASLDPVIAWLRTHDRTWVDSADKVGAIARRRTDGIQQIFFQDPDGYWIEVNDALKR